MTQGNGYAGRVADPDDPLRYLLQAAIRAHIPPTIFLRKRTVETPWWTDEDTSLIMALEDYEASLCPGGNHVLAETSLPDRVDAYRPGEHIRCHKCKADALVADTVEKQYDGDTGGLIVPTVLDADVVELNRRPRPPLPPELAF